MLTKIKEALREELNKLYAHRDNRIDDNRPCQAAEFQKAIDELIKVICSIDRILIIYGE